MLTWKRSSGSSWPLENRKKGHVKTLTVRVNTEDPDQTSHLCNLIRTSLYVDIHWLCKWSAEAPMRLRKVSDYCGHTTVVVFFVLFCFYLFRSI